MKRRGIGLVELLVLRVVADSTQPIQPFTVMIRSRLSSGLAMEALSNLESNSLISVKEKRVSITDLGFRYLTERVDELGKRDKKWKAVPLRFRGSQLSKDVPYVPLRSLLDRNFV